MHPKSLFLAAIFFLILLFTKIVTSKSDDVINFSNLCGELKEKMENLNVDRVQNTSVVLELNFIKYIYKKIYLLEEIANGFYMYHKFFNEVSLKSSENLLKYTKKIRKEQTNGNVRGAKLKLWMRHETFDNEILNKIIKKNFWGKYFSKRKFLREKILEKKFFRGRGIEGRKSFIK
jgi:hypothetical protein